MSLQNLVTNFNSIKVRLEPLILFEKSMLSVFQFHKGTIRTQLATTANNDKIYFNSIKVRLELS